MTPEKTLYQGEVEFAVVQAHDGEMGFLPDHLPILGELGIGEMRIMNKQQVESMVIEGGIVEVSNNTVTVLTENAVLKKDLNIDNLQEELKFFLESDDDTYNKAFRKAKKEKLKARIRVAMK
jgi:F-type H+-transporting ATPase subunit epsilon